MNTDLIARYIYAVTRGLAPTIRPDVEKELDGLIADMLDQRSAESAPAEADIRAVLAELGDPDELAAKYNADGQGALISGRHFVVYRRLLRIVLPIGAAASALAAMVSFIQDSTAAAPSDWSVSSAVSQVVAAAVGGAIEAFAVITIVFALIERRQTGASGRDFLANLPSVPTAAARIKPSGPIISMMLWIVLAIVFLGFPQIIGAWGDGTGYIPVFTTAVLRGLWLPIIAWAVLGIAKDAVRLLEEAYTVRVALVTLVANVLIVGCTAVVFLHPGIMNPDFIAHLGDFVVGEHTRLVWVGGENLNVVAFGVICLAVAVETVVAWVKALAGRSSSPWS